MNEALMRAVVESLAFAELTDEDYLDLDAAVKTRGNDGVYPQRPDAAGTGGVLRLRPENGGRRGTAGWPDAADGVPTFDARSVGAGGTARLET